MALPRSLPAQAGDSGLDTQMCFFVKISVPLNWFSWGSEFLYLLCRLENFSMIWPNLRHALLPAVA